MEFSEDSASCCLCSAPTMAAGLDMPYQHASVQSETPLGALFFPRAPVRSCWLSQLCDSDEQQDFPSAQAVTGTVQLSCVLGIWRLFHVGE